MESARLDLPEDNPTPGTQAPGIDGDRSAQASHAVRSLRELVEMVSGRGVTPLPGEASGLAEVVAYPFLALVGQLEMKLALLMSLINPAIGGVLLIGPRGTGKTTAIRGLVDLLPEVPRSLCYYGCMPEDIETGGMDAVCPACAQKYAQGDPLAVFDKVRLVELPLSARLDDVVGHSEGRQDGTERPIFRKGILAQADRNLLHLDEVNLMAAEVIDAILDAAAQGVYHIRRGSVAATFHSRLVLIGSMNPEEGNLRPQIMDRFGLRVVVRGLVDERERLTAYQRAQAYRDKPRLLAHQYSDATNFARTEIQASRDLLQEVTLPEDVSRIGLSIIHRMKIDSLRAEITLFETARAYAALDGRREVTREDVKVVAPMALCMRRSHYMQKFLSEIALEDDEISGIINSSSL